MHDRAFNLIKSLCTVLVIVYRTVQSNLGEYLLTTIIIAQRKRHAKRSCIKIAISKSNAGKRHNSVMGQNKFT
ncbi:hypothetical protein BHC43_10060 [Snodgrassella alvi]|nr:hypothetical protein BHC43_10060 [Snodgrassella alvi]